MQSDRTITVQLTSSQAAEAMMACINQRNELDKVRQHLLTQEKPVDEIARIGMCVKDLHRAECALREAIGNG